MELLLLLLLLPSFIITIIVIGRWLSSSALNSIIIRTDKSQTQHKNKKILHTWYILEVRNSRLGACYSVNFPQIVTIF
jgi:hypothetical protein